MPNFSLACPYDNNECKRWNLVHGHVINIPTVTGPALRPSKMRQWKGNRADEVSCNTHAVKQAVEASWNVMAHAQKSDFVFRQNGRVHLNRRGRQFSRLLAAETCASAVVMLDTTCSQVVWRVLATHSIRQFPLHFLSRASPCAITFQLVWRQVASAIIICTVTPNFCGTSIWNLPHVTLLAPRILK